MQINRPAWANASVAMQDYYDHYWGFPVHDERFLFEMLSLEAFQAGLSWATIWQRRAGFERAFRDFQIDEVATFNAQDVERLLDDPEIIRNRRKIEAVIHNARVITGLHTAGQTFDDYVWHFVDYQPQRLIVKVGAALPAQTDQSRQIARQMKKDGLAFVGPTTVYSFMTAVGLVNARL
ncbi:DNA-3-methyladenine glycosylase I [Limosilactobacillus antri]|uniref:DNA-3-methyladenine glycosylase I n=1 Tax=Limosilactobacillus antri TaxID=227943 RepID=UPI001F55F46D|nr:DNA-3-methyladenine glycosylase I [Limosilactobacillus antri]